MNRFAIILKAIDTYIFIAALRQKSKRPGVTKIVHKGVE
jgi:hypothetical protein